ncbi:MAG: hypothetical protein F6K18_01235 [Okeania sp. SIO2C2]|nr:hypothetical protein [Okeania sp. SIO2C2]NEP85552.1 hypothetical protein [Okeania sp. SIO2C2]
MTPETIVTVGMVTTIFSVIGCSWIVFRYIGRIENQIRKNAVDINNLGNSVRRKNKNLLRHMNSHCTYIGDIESFLEEYLNYRPHTKIYVADED